MVSEDPFFWPPAPLLPLLLLLLLPPALVAKLEAHSRGVRIQPANIGHNLDKTLSWPLLSKIRAHQRAHEAKGGRTREALVVRAAIVTGGRQRWQIYQNNQHKSGRKHAGQMDRPTAHLPLQLRLDQPHLRAGLCSVKIRVGAGSSDGQCRRASVDEFCNQLEINLVYRFAQARNRKLIYVRAPLCNQLAASRVENRFRRPNYWLAQLSR